MNNFLNERASTIQVPLALRQVGIRKPASQQSNAWVAFPECAKPLCSKVAEFVTSGAEGHFGSEHICYEHAQDEPDAVRCLCTRAAVGAFI